MGVNSEKWEIYAKEMGDPCRGDALWYPYTGINIGDVGYIHNGRLPNTFAELFIGNLESGELEPGCYHSEHVEPRGLLVAGQRFTPLPHDEKDLFMFDLKGSKGAAMVTRHPIHRKDSNSLNDNPRLFDEIFKRINSPQGIHPVLVSGFDAVKDFEVVSYPNSDGGSFKPKRPITENMFKSLPPPFRGKWCFQFAPHIHRDSSAEFDQCLFVRYHTLRHKGGTSRIPRVLRGGAGPHDLGSGDNQGGAFPELTVQSSAQPTIGIDEDTGRPLGLPAGDASSGSSGVIKGRDEGHDKWDVVADYIFRNSNAVTALMHHRDFAEIYAAGDTRDLATVLEERRPRIIEKDGVGMIACQETQRPGVLAEGSNIPILVGHHLASALSNVSMKDHPLQQLRDLDRASPHFYVQLSNLLRGDAYQELLPRLQADDSCWLVEYLDSVLAGISDRTLLAFQETLHELSNVSGMKKVLPRSCSVSESLLVRRGEETYDGSRVHIRYVRVYPTEDLQKVKGLVYQAAVVLKHLAHPNVVPLVGVTVDPFSLISVWMPGGDLLAYLADHPGAGKRSLLSDVAKGLGYLHSCDVIHGNLKGSNILVDATNHARIADSGFAVVMEDRRASAERNQGIKWIAPEILDDRGTYSKEADVFSYAGVIIEVFTGSAPFSNELPHEATFAITRDKRPPRPTHPSMTDELWALTQQCWSRDVHLRPTPLQILRSLGAPTWKLVINQRHSADENAIENTSLIADVLSNDNEIESVELLFGEDVQWFIDVMDQALDRVDPWLRRKCLDTLFDICSRERLLPKSVQIPLDYDRNGTPQVRGMNASVFKGEYQGREVAVKVMARSRGGLREVVRRFCWEVLIWKILHHPNVLPLLGAAIDMCAMVSPWMDNGDINQFIDTHKNADRFEPLRDVCQGVIYMHSKGIIHRDLRGTNILIDQHGHACLTNFGSSTILDPAGPNDSASWSTETLRWMSPELLTDDRRNKETKNSDCYALGMVIFEVLSGRPPFAGHKPYTLRETILEGKRPERPKGPSFTDDLWRTLEQCWLHQPEDRPSIEVVLESLERASEVWKSLPPGTNYDIQVDSESDEGASSREE